MEFVLMALLRIPKEMWIIATQRFSRTHNRKVVPPSIFIDMEPTVIDEVCSGKYKDLFHPDQLIIGKEDAANNFVRGYNAIGRDMIEPVTDRIRSIAEQS